MLSNLFASQAVVRSRPQGTTAKSRELAFKSPPSHLYHSYRLQALRLANRRCQQFL